jgi:nitronate monooxygenase
VAPELKRRALKLSREGRARVYTDRLASPTGFPFKVAQLEGTLSDPRCYEARPRVCDLGYLRQLYRKPDGGVGYRCPAEPVEIYQRHGGALEETKGRKCICNGLMATAGLGQYRPGIGVEPPIVTAGDDLAQVAEFLEPGRDSYTAADVLKRLLADS